MAKESVLLVDDEKAYLLALQDMLQSEGYKVDTAETLIDACANIKGNSYSTVIADVRLTGTLSAEGLAVLDAVKQASKATKVIVITGFGSAEIMKAAFLRGADYYFEKPVSFKTIMNAIQETRVH